MKAAERLLAWRSSLDLSQAEAAERADMSQSAWCDYEAGRSRPKVDQAIRIAAVTRGSPYHVLVEDWAESAADRTARLQRMAAKRAKVKRLRPKRSAAPPKKTGTDG